MQEAAQTLTQDTPVIYGGFEDEPAAENGELAAADECFEADDAADAQAVEPELHGVQVPKRVPEAGDEAAQSGSRADDDA